jgi:hypothetical protein
MLNNASKLGIVVTPSGISASFCDDRGTISQQEDLNASIDFSSPNLTGLSPAISTITKRFAHKIKRADNQVFLALPDACFQQSQLEFDDFPKSGKEAKELITWRHCDELSLTASDMSIGYRKVNSISTGKTYVLAQSIPRNIVNACTDALWQSSLVADQIDSLGCFLMAGLRSTRPQGQGAVFWYSNDDWSFRMVNSYGEMEPQFGSWTTQERDGELIARRFKRVAKIYEEQTANKLNFVQITGMKDAEIDAVETVITAMDIPVVRSIFDDLKQPSKIVAVAQ